MAQLRYNSLPAININDSLRILSGTFLNYVRSVNCYGHVENNGINLNTSGYLVMNGDAAQTIAEKVCLLICASISRLRAQPM